jgi:hypothetical protein
MRQRKEGKDPTFNPKDIGNNTPIWDEIREENLRKKYLFFIMLIPTNS